MIKQPLVSVLMTAYNREKYVGEAIESVLAQTYTNFELIIVDDCSTDSTVAIASNYAVSDARIRLYVNSQNLGQFANRNKAATLANGAYLKYVDSDDTISTNCLQTMLSAMLQFPEAVWGTEKVANTLATSYLKRAQLPISVNSTLAFRAHFEEGGFLYAGPIATIYLKFAFEQVGGFAEDLGINADVDLNLKLAAFGKCVLIGENLVTWRRHSEQVDVQQADKLRMATERLVIHKKNLLQPTSDAIQRICLQKWLLIQKILFARNILHFVMQRRNLWLLFRYTGKSTIAFYELCYAIVPIRLLNFFKR